MWYVMYKGKAIGQDTIKPMAIKKALKFSKNLPALLQSGEAYIEWAPMQPNQFFMTISKSDIETSIMRTHMYRYQDKEGYVWHGLPISQLAQCLRVNGFRNVPRFDTYTCKSLKLNVAKARYVGGVNPKRFCDCVLVDMVDDDGDKEGYSAAWGKL